MDAGVQEYFSELGANDTLSKETISYFCYEDCGNTLYHFDIDLAKDCEGNDDPFAVRHQKANYNYAIEYYNVYIQGQEYIADVLMQACDVDGENRYCLLDWEYPVDYYFNSDIYVSQ